MIITIYYYYCCRLYCASKNEQLLNANRGNIYDLLLYRALVCVVTHLQTVVQLKPYILHLYLSGISHVRSFSYTFNELVNGFWHDVLRNLFTWHTISSPSEVPGESRGSRGICLAVQIPARNTLRWIVQKSMAVRRSATGEVDVKVTLSLERSLSQLWKQERVVSVFVGAIRSPECHRIQICQWIQWCVRLLLTSDVEYRW